jgi:hypothetical protein
MRKTKEKMERQANRTETEMNNDEQLNTYEFEGNNLARGENRVVSYTGYSKVGSFRVHELILLAGLLGLILFAITKIKRK